jgi:hypothetical protein
VLLALNASSPNIKALSAGAFHEWARLISNGEDDVSMVRPPQSVSARKSSPVFTYERVCPAYRPKSKPAAVAAEMFEASEEDSDPIGKPSPSGSSLTKYSQPGPAAGFVLPAAAPGDADGSVWFTFEKRVRVILFWFMTVLTVA